ncbi:unnamed protein product [Plutella xylostella]|uniref:(diamondback moth) hypothetical protein n=1 Tax=Plutella xylostella TaxID=51655 RepID=A0A8S4FNM1_PLUXY|nr:unnamed protein product [Plutella xylostella]
MDRPLCRSARVKKNEVSADQESRPDDQQPRVPCSDRSSSTRSSAATMRRLAEARAARELAELEERRLEIEQRRLEEQRQLEQRRLEAERARIEAGLEEEKAQIEVEEVEKASSRASLSRVEKASSRASLSRVVHWLNQNHSPKPETNRNDKLLGRLSARDLPTFSGDALEWLRFKHAFESTTRIGQYSEDENVARLQRCLRGEAWETVAARIITVSSAQEIMKTLEMRFGRPDLIVQKIIGEIKKIPKLSSSRTELVTLATKVSNCIAAITATNCSDYLYSPDLVMEIVNKLTENLVYRWIDYSVTQDAARRPKLAALSDYLMREAELVCRAGVMEPQLKTKTFSSGFGRHPVLAMVDDYTDSGATNAVNMASINAVSFQKRGGQTDTTRPHCPFCEKDGHDLDSCSPFSDRSVDERWDWICNKKLCFKCFSPKHRRERCRSRRQCATCSRGHHTLLHREDWLNWTKSKQSNGDNDKTTETTANLWTKPEQEGRRYVGVLPVNVEGPAGSVRTCVMIDGGSTISLIDSRLAEKIGAEGPRVNLNLQGAVGETKRENDSLAVAVTLHTSTGSFYLPKIRTVDSLRLPTQKVDRKLIESCLHLQDVPLEEYDGYPEILIGQDYLQLILIRENREGRANEPVASRTNLGWVLHGFVSSSCKVNKEFTNHLHHSEADVELHELVNDYFRVDSLGVKHEENDKFSPGEQRAMSILDAKTRKIGDRWETGLLWRSDDVALPENKGSAVQRLKVIERMMDVDPAFSIDYSKQVDNLLEKHYAEEVHETLAGPRLWYLPHFGVRNPSKPGKLRLVHDARAETKGISLNTELLAGPDLLNSLVGVLFRFRERAVAVTGDIKEMFMRVKINEEDQKSQLFLWRGMNRDQPPRTYKMTSMIFGAKSSPCTATYIIRKNADQYAEFHPRAVIAIKRRHYVDDYCDSVDTVEEMKQLVADVTAIHYAGGFEIRGFVSNKPECLPEPTETPSVSLLQTESSQRTLGMIWKPQKDALGFDLSFKKLEADIVDGSQKPTKRQMHKVIMSVFDPLGFLGPLLIRGKILLQQLWHGCVSTCPHWFLDRLEYRVVYGYWDFEPKCILECGRTDFNEAVPLASVTSRPPHNLAPWRAGVYLLRDEGYMLICEASILKEKLIITAAHCFWDKSSKSSRSVKLFAVAVNKQHRAWNDIRDAPYEQKRNVSRIVYPANFTGSATKYAEDLALVHLSAPIKFHTSVLPICVDLNDVFERFTFSNEATSVGQMIGWGFESRDAPAEEVHMSDYEYLTPAACRARRPEIEHIMAPTKFCAAVKDDGLVCKGDSGAGLVFPAVEKGVTRHYLRGVASSMLFNGDVCSKAIVLFTQVTKMKQFFYLNS